MEKQDPTQSTQVPETVIDSGDLATVLRVADLGQQDRRGHLSQTVSES